MVRDEQSSGAVKAVPAKIEKAAIKEPITVKDFSAVIGVRVGEILGKLLHMGAPATINDILDADSAMAVALEYG